MGWVADKRFKRQLREDERLFEHLIAQGKPRKRPTVRYTSYAVSVSGTPDVPTTARPIESAADCCEKGCPWPGQYKIRDLWGTQIYCAQHAKFLDLRASSFDGDYPSLYRGSTSIPETDQSSIRQRSRMYVPMNREGKWDGFHVVGPKGADGRKTLTFSQEVHLGRCLLIAKMHTRDASVEVGCSETSARRLLERIAPEELQHRRDERLKKLDRESHWNPIVREAINSSRLTVGIPQNESPVKYANRLRSILRSNRRSSGWRWSVAINQAARTMEVRQGKPWGIDLGAEIQRLQRRFAG